MQFFISTKAVQKLQAVWKQPRVMNCQHADRKVNNVKMKPAFESHSMVQRCNGLNHKTNDCYYSDSECHAYRKIVHVKNDFH